MAKMFAVQQKTFPLASKYLGVALPAVLNDPKLLQPFLQFSGLTPAEASDALRMDTASPLIFGSSLGAFVYGQFDPEVPDRIEIAMEVFRQFEGATNRAAAESFLIAKVLHEMCHWGCCRKHLSDNDSSGEAFETSVYGSEQVGWWASPQPPVALAGVGGTSFDTPLVRANLLKSLLAGKGFAPGRGQDPQHAVFGGEDAAIAMPRGFRNNNPGNIRRSGSAWRGLADPDDMLPFQRDEASFCVFREPEWGLRALAKLLQTYQTDHGLNTPRKIISRWAPASDNNDVDAYAGALAVALAVGRDDTIDVLRDATMITIMKAISRHENGDRPPYADMQYDTALMLLA